MTFSLQPGRPWLVAASLAAACGIAQAAPLQVSSGGLNSLGPSLSADGSRLAFYSASNIGGTNPDNNFEVFVYERASGQTRQITDMPGGIQAGGSQEPSLSGDGSRLAFQRFQVSGNTALFQTQSYDLNSHTLTTLTPLGGAFEQSAISGDGKRIAVSTDNLGVRFYDAASQSFSAVVAPSVFNMSMSGDGKRLAYEGMGGVKLFDVDTGITTAVAPQNGAFNQRPMLSADGSRLTFVSTFNPLGQNADGNRELFSFDTLTQSFEQLTHTAGGQMDLGGISGDGSRIAFSSSADLVGENADGNVEVFVYDLLAGDFQQVTHALDGFSVDATISEDGLTVAYVASRDRGPMQVFIDALEPRQPDGRLPEPASLALVLAALALLPTVRRARSN
jgi:Tol biopolymer transport system component